MTSVSLFSGKMLTNEFWEKYGTLWVNASLKSSFYGPEFLKEFIDDTSIAPEFYVATDTQGQFIASLALKKVNGVYEFLSTGHSDHNPFIIHKNYHERGQAILNETFKLLKHKIFLKNIPSWNNDLEWYTNASKVSGKQIVAFPAWKCPMVEYSAPSEKTAEVFFREIFKKSRLQTYFNKIQKMEGFAYEVEDTETADLRDWTNEFCLNHELRWNATLTPSMFINPENRATLYNKLKGWHKDGTCYRFSISAEGRRLAMVICLSEGNSLLYALPVYAPDYEHTHTSSVLLSKIGIWTGDKGYNIFDFGVGTEGYKMRYANTVKDVYRAYIIPSKIFSFNFKASFDRMIRENNMMAALWEKYGLELYRGKIGKIKTRLGVKLKIQLKDTKKDILAVPRKFLRRIKPSNEYYYYSPSVSKAETNKEYTYRQLSIYEVLDFLAAQIPMTPATRHMYITDFVTKKRIPYGLFISGVLVQLSWLKEAGANDIPEGLNNKYSHTSWMIIMDCHTHENYRGKGYYGKVLHYLRTLDEYKNSGFIIYTDYWNIASQKGITKSGFLKVAEKITKKNLVEWKQEKK
ncbi:MAG TPA: GNAT family N-acetyltransferase [Bacteroidia bacterium]|nr:GNAT family N-acetyltransferase [Bacteroidia bacterium]